MAGGFDMMELMNEATKNKATKPKYEMKTLSIEELIPNPANHYNMTGIDELADSILLAGRVLQNIVVKAADSQGRYMIISGHRRVEACSKLVLEGHAEFGTIPALVENEADENLRELVLIYTNSTSRILTDAEKMRQAQRATEILKNLKAEGKFEGRIRDAVSRMLDTTGAQLARYAAIAKNLTNPELKEAFDDGRLGVSAAYEASGLSDDGQQKIADKLQDGSAVSIQDVKDTKELEKPAEALTNSEGIPMREVKLDLNKKFKAKITINVIEKDGKFYAASDVWYKSGGWGGYPTAEYGTPYDTEQEAIEAEIRDIAEHNEELHRVLWESGYRIVGDPDAKRQEETAQPPAEHHSPAGEMPVPPTGEEEPPASVEEDTEPNAEGREDAEQEEKPAEEKSEDTEPPVSPEVYAMKTVINELSALEESYRGAAERHIAMGCKAQGKENLQMTAALFRRLIEQTKAELEKTEEGKA